MNDSETAFNRLVGAYCGPLLVVRHFPKALSRLNECVQLTGLEIVRSISCTNDRAKYVYFQDFDRLATLLQYDLDHLLLDSLKKNDDEVGKMLESNLEESFVTYPRWFRDWCATLATVLRIDRHKKYNIALERNGVFVFCHKDDDYDLLNSTFVDYKDFPLSLVYLIDGYSEEDHEHTSDDNQDNEELSKEDKEKELGEKDDDTNEKEEQKEVQDQTEHGSNDVHSELLDTENKTNEDHQSTKELSEEVNDDQVKLYVFEQKPRETINSEELQETVTPTRVKEKDKDSKEDKENESEKLHDEEELLYSDKFEQVERSNDPEFDRDNLLGEEQIEEMNKEMEEDAEELDRLKEIIHKKDIDPHKDDHKIPPQVLELIRKYNVKYHVIDTTQDFCNSDELIWFVDGFVDFCNERLKANFESLNSSLKGLKLSSKLLKSPDVDKTMAKLMMLVCDEMFVGQDSLIVSLLKSSLEHDIQALSQMLYGVYLYRFKKHQPKSESKHEGEWASEEDGKIFIDAYTTISHFDKAIGLFNKYSFPRESFFISILSSLLGDYEEINKLLSKNSLLELKTESDYGRSALCLELSSNRCTKVKKKKFQLMMAGRLYNQASLINLSKRCYLSCLEEYEGWDIANEHLYSLLGDFDNNYLVNSLNVLSNNYENKYSSQRCFEDTDSDKDKSKEVKEKEKDSKEKDSKEDNQGLVEKGSKELESNSEKEVYYLRKLMKLNGFQMETKYLVNTPISGSFENYPTIYYQQHPLPLVDGETPFLVRIPILYLRKNGIIGTNVKLTTSYVDDLYEKLFENSFKDNTWHKCIKFDSIKDHVKKDFFNVSQASRGPNYMVDTKLNLSLQLLNPLNITVDCFPFKILVRRVNTFPGLGNKYQQKKNEDNTNTTNSTIFSKDSDRNSSSTNKTSTTTQNINSKQSKEVKEKEKENKTDLDLKWIECEIKSFDESGFQLKEFEKKNLLLTFKAEDVGSFKIEGLCWKLFDRVHFWSPLYTVGNKLKNYEFTKKITLKEFVEQRTVDKTLYFNVYEDRPKVNYHFKKVSDLTELRNSVYFVKKDFEFVNNDNLLRFYSEKYSEMTRELDCNKSVEENENLCLFDFFNGESSLIELKLQNLQDLPLSSLVLRFKVLGIFKTVPYPVAYKVHFNKRTEGEDTANTTSSTFSKDSDRNSSSTNKTSTTTQNINSKESKDVKEEPSIDCVWNVINLPNVKVKEESLTEKMYEVFMKFKDENFTLYNNTLSIYFFLEPLNFLDGIALIDGSFGVVPQSGLDLLVPFKLFLSVKKGPSFKSYYDYKEVVKVKVHNKSKEEITQLDFTVNDKHVYSTDSQPQTDTATSSLSSLQESVLESESSDSSAPPSTNSSLRSTSIPSKSTMNYILPIEDPVLALINTNVSPSERMSFSVFWSTLNRFGVFNGYVEFVEYKLLVKVVASPKEFKSNGDPAVVDLYLTLQNLSSETVKSLSVSPLQDYESESLVSYIGETRKSVDKITPGSSVSLFYQIVLPLPGIYHFSPLSFKLDTTLDEKNVNYQNHVNTVIVYD